MRTTDSRRFIVPILGTIMIALFSASLASHAYIGSFTRMISDDYDHIVRVQKLGIWGAQVEMYLTWAGRYASTFTVSLPAFFGPKFAALLPSIMLTAWLVSLTWAIYQLRNLVGWPRPWLTALFLAELVLVCMLVAMPSLFQCMYWQTGVLTYTVPLVLLTLYAGLLCRIATRPPSHRRPCLLVCTGLLAFLAGGFVEPLTAIQGTSLAAAWLLCISCASYRLKRALLPFLTAGLVATALATIVMLTAPGNEARIASSAEASEVKPSGNLFSMIQYAIWFGYDSIRYSVLTSRPTAAAAILLPGIVGLFLHRGRNELSPPSSDRQMKRLVVLLVLPFAVFLLMVLSKLGSAYAAAYVRAGYYPQLRTFGVSQYTFFCFASLWGYLAGLYLRELSLYRQPGLTRLLFWPSAGIAALLLVVPFNSARRTMALAPTVRAYAAAWEVQDRAIRTAKLQGVQHVVVAALPGTVSDKPGNLYFGLRLLGSDPEYWTNKCAADFYGVSSITAE